ncbi:PAS domain S-box-containing protein/diguanylate cyclase (GGDEF) domain-containing protein [Modicisalibacter muralis]|uniref:PAS domain S-box-containing protein/diguanylate cyclase (GGDEF) domain-containing protein n=1 Tax=Modicisalibacter muralis TaxID=119000 RepID=A0A1G9RLW6_9GAMM|nr:diguanylate cyclase [Halomonas muralis]SDM24238.1 PAS domain S-box-containing protein/diguanylate cyclase (GGDEF) domain-containing protein [Halomonas muralis]
MHKRLLLGLAIGWVVVVAVILVWTWQSGQSLIRQANNAHLDYEARLIAADIEQSIDLRIKVLKRLARTLDPSQPLDAPALRGELRKHDALLALFDGMIVIGSEGRVLADWPWQEGRPGLDVTDRTYFQFQRHVGRPYVSEPFFGRASETPLVMISVPLHDRNGDFAGVLGGVISVLHGSFFDKLRSIRIGGQGFAAVMSVAGKVLVHPDYDWLLRPVPSAQQNPWLDLALSGWEGTAIGPLVSGEMALQAYQQVWSAGWIVGVFVPLEQAFAPLQWFVRNLWWVGALTVVVMFALLWWLLNIALLPLHRLERQIGAVGQGHRDQVDLRTHTTELTKVAETFNRVAHSRREAEGRLLDRQAFLDAVLASSPIGMFVYDPDGEIRYINPAMSSLTGYTLDQYRQQGQLNHVHPDDRGDVIDLWADSLATGRDFQRQYRYITARGETIWVEAHATLVRLQSGKPLGFVGTLKDITQRREMEALQRWEAEHDPLTGLLNRRGFERRLEEALADWQKSQNSAALILFDLDHFKPINDEGGHALGDEMLQRIAATIGLKVRKSDYLARHGGDEFAVLMPGCGLEQAQNTAQALRLAVETLSVEHAGKQYRVSLSLGVTAFRDSDRTIDAPLQRADQASYQAKAQGRNRAVVAQD